MRTRVQDLPHRPDREHQAIVTDEQGTPGRTTPHPLDQPPDQGHVPPFADLTAQPHARLDPHGQRHPHDTTLFFYADLIGLYVPQVPWLFDQALLDGLPLSPGAGHQSATVRSSHPNAATIACTGHP